jgi:hypothetical protein
LYYGTTIASHPSSLFGNAAISLANSKVLAHYRVANIEDFPQKLAIL